MNQESCDVLVIGAGPAGSVAAALMHRAGFHVSVVEKEKFPRFVIGESLLPRCMEVLKDCNLLEAVKEKKFQEKFGAKFVKGDQVADYNFSEQFTPGWHWTWQVPRAEFDSVLINTVSSWGVQVDFEASVTHIQFFDDESSVTTIQKVDGSLTSIKAKFIIDASGYGRVIPRLFKLDAPSSLTPRKAVFAHVEDPHRLEFEEPNRIIIVNYAPETWTWIIPFSNRVTSLGFVGKQSFFQGNDNDLGNQFDLLIEQSPYLKGRFGESKKIFEPRKLEGWSTKTEKFYGKGFVLTGNVTEFLDPIFSSGVMFATVSSHIASQLVIKKLKGATVEWEKEYTQALQTGVDTFKAFVNAWYDGTLEKIFYHKEQDPLAKRQVTSILAGYVWDEKNPFVKEPKVALKRLVKLIDFENRTRIPVQGNG
jgi:flavin-dependent dehydrogenase